MLRKAALSVVLAALLGVPAGAQNTGAPAAPTAMAVVKAADAAIGASAAKSIRYTGTDGYVAVIGQSPTPGISDGWPRFHLKAFSRVIDYETNSMREEQVRTQGDNPSEVGGGQRPIIGERKSVSLYRDGYAWNENPDGSVVPRPQDVTVRRLEIIMTPHGFIRAALQAKDLKLEERAESFRSNKRIRTVTFKYIDKFPITGWIDEANHVTKVQTWHPNPVVGDQFVETRYAQYRQLDGFSFGTEVHQSIGTPPHPSYDFTAANLAINVSNAALEIPAAVKQATDNSGAVATKELSPGVWLIGGNGYNSVAVEFAEFSLVVEAPLNEQRSQAVMKEVRRLIPTKPIRYVVNTHHHFDHAGGLRGYGAEDVLIVTQEQNFDYYEALATALHPQTIEPEFTRAYATPGALCPRAGPPHHHGRSPSGAALSREGPASRVRHDDRVPPQRGTSHPGRPVRATTGRCDARADGAQHGPSPHDPARQHQTNADGLDPFWRSADRRLPARRRSA